MDKIHRKALRQCRSELVSDLSPDNEFWDKVAEEEIFTPLMLEYIQAKTPRPAKVRKLLDNLERRGPDAYGKFLYCLDTSGHRYLADCIRAKENAIQNGNHAVRSRIRPSVKQETQFPSAESSMTGLQCTEPSNLGDRPLHISVSADPLSQHQNNPLPRIYGSQSSPNVAASGSIVSAPSDELLYNRTSGQITSNDDDDVLMLNENDAILNDNDGSSEITSATVLNTSNQNRAEPNVQSAPVRPKTYKMMSSPRGFVLIINNIFFTNGHHRPGAERDGEMLKQLFIHLGFQVNMKENKTAQEIDRLLLEFSQLNDLCRIDSVIVVLMSHGNSDVILGIDTRPNSVYSLIKYFDRDHCPAMNNKPKMFIINACRGLETDYNARLGMTEPCVDITVLPDSLPEPLNELPANSDFVLAYSTFPGYVSYRDENSGSWFIQNLVEVFQEEAAQEHVMDMLTQVNDKVAARSEEESGVNQTPAPITTLRYKWYLNPPSS